MIREYNKDDKAMLCEFFANILEEHKDYISHGELQMGIAVDSGVLAPDFREKWAEYLDRQMAIAENRILLNEDDGLLNGFIIFGITDDGDAPFGMIFDLAVTPECRGKHIGQSLVEKAMEYFKQSNIKGCYLESGVNNHSAHHFFERHGFAHVSNIYRLKL
jgi:ribosomal protein S18 acetylase RimI-like enzyme